MRIERLRLLNWRNYQEAELVFDPHTNIICGANAQGKTNLLEAVSYLGLASSFRGAADSELINHGSDHFFISATLSSEQAGKIEISAAYNRLRQRKWVVNGLIRPRLADIIGICHTVVFSPEDIYLVKGGPERRRRWLNRQLAQADPVYCRDMLHYNQVLRQRNALLRRWDGAARPSTLMAWDQQLAFYGARITARRQRTMGELLPLAVAIHAGLSGGEQLSMSYRSQLLSRDEAAAETDIDRLEQVFIAELQRHAPAELQRRTTLVGPHRDEIRLILEGESARDFASQGQQRTLAISLKLAELDWARQQRGEYPILLLDDVLSELDESRRQRILELPEQVQTFITAAGQQPGLEGRSWQVAVVDGFAQVR